MTGPSENAQVRNVQVPDLRVDQPLERGRIEAKRQIPVAEHDVLRHAVGLQHERAQRLGDAVEAQAVLEDLPHLREARPPQRRPESVDELGERADVGTVVDRDHAARRVGGCVDAGETARHRVPDDDRPLHRQGHEKLLDPSSDLVERRGRAAALAVGGQVDGKTRHRAAEPVDDRPPGSAVEGQAVEKTTGIPAPSIS